MAKRLSVIDNGTDSLFAACRLFIWLTNICDKFNDSKSYINRLKYFNERIYFYNLYFFGLL